ncbi:MAG: hypothetical protein HFI26_08355 [Lachnospiraceae bacterium]|nr:hypothetical protein [Lachnospiraceae bacterium]
MKRMSEIIEKISDEDSKLSKFVDKYGDKVLEICDKAFPPVLLAWAIAALAEIILILIK